MSASSTFSIPIPAAPVRATRPASRGRLRSASAPSSRVVSGDDAVGLAHDALGGKAAGLAALVRDGARVPAFFCVTTPVFDEVLARIRGEVTEILESLDYRDRAAVKHASEMIRASFLCAELAAADRAAVVRAFDALSGDAEFVSVRSSAVGEDSGKDSFAGQLDTYLFVKREDLVESILACFASAFSERALLYRHLRSLSPMDVRSAVVVQRMIDARASGVLFTANPTTGDRNDLVISAGLGLGEGIVTGSVECDTYFVNAAARTVRDRNVAQKRSRVVFDARSGRGTTMAEVHGDDVERPVLGDAQLHELTDVGLAIAARAGAPHDVEWALDEGGTLYVLQARPITTLTKGRQSIYDNSNVVESYPGLSSPLTFSFVRLGYEILFRESSRLFGVTDEALANNHDIYPNLLGLLDGRIYYNITNWYRLFLQLPGMERAIPAWEKALGIEQRFARPAKRKTVWDVIFGIPVRLALVFRLLRNWIALPAMVRRFRDRCQELGADFAARNVAALDAHDLVELSETYGRELRPAYAVTVVNDFVTQQLYEIVGRLIGSFGLGDPVATRNELLCGERGMESVEPVRSILRLAERIREDAALRALFEHGGDADTVFARIASEPAFADFHGAVMHHIDLYGDRTLEELKLETPVLADRPAQIVPMLRNYLRGGQNVDAMERREQQIRHRAERRVAEALRLRPARRALFGFVLATCRWGIKTRENLRLARSRSFGIFKRIYRAVGEKLREAGELGRADDVFFIGIDEIAAFVRGESLTRDLRALVALRRREYEGFRAQALAPRVVTHGVVYGNAFHRALGVRDGEKVLRGIGCSPRRVTAPARVILEPQSDLTIDGEILVAAATDPGWVFLMVAAGGLVSEKGSVLSHTAIIGRELGIPTVVGVADATTRLSHGAVVELDGQSGTLTILTDGAPSHSR